MINMESKMKIQIISITIIVGFLTSCISMQQMHGAQVVPEGEKEVVIGVSVLPILVNEDGESAALSVIQYNARKGVHSRLDYGYHIYLPASFEFSDEGESSFQPLIPAGGIDFKFQFFEGDKIDLAINAGLEVAIPASINFGLIAGGDKSYASFHVHIDEWNSYLYSLTFGRKTENMIYELRLPISPDEMLVVPVLSIGFIK